MFKEYILNLYVDGNTPTLRNPHFSIQKQNKIVKKKNIKENFSKKTFHNNMTELLLQY